MALRGKLSKLEKAARGLLEWIRLPDGSRFYFDPEETFWELFVYGCEQLDLDGRALAAEEQGEPTADEAPPEPPGILGVVVGSLRTREEREEAFWRIYYHAASPLAPYDVEHFLETGKIVPRSLGATHWARHRAPEAVADDGG